MKQLANVTRRPKLTVVARPERGELWAILDLSALLGLLLALWYWWTLVLAMADLLAARLDLLAARLDLALALAGVAGRALAWGLLT